MVAIVNTNAAREGKVKHKSFVFRSSKPQVLSVFGFADYLDCFISVEFALT